VKVVVENRKEFNDSYNFFVQISSITIFLSEQYNQGMGVDTYYE